MSTQAASKRMSDQLLSEKVLRFETFLNDQLKPDLQAILKERDAVYCDMAELLALKNSLLAVKAAELKPGQPLRTRSDIGCNFYVEASIPDPSTVYVEIGLGFYLEMRHDEALAYVEKKTKVLEEKATVLTDQACKVKANVKVTLHGLRELQGLAGKDVLAEQRRAKYDPFS
jgi:prefoldin subunit 5